MSFPVPGCPPTGETGRAAVEALCERAEGVRYVRLLREIESRSIGTFEEIVTSGEYRTVFDRNGVILMVRWPARWTGSDDFPNVLHLFFARGLPP